MEFENRLHLDSLREMVQQVKHQIGKTIIGQDNFIDLLLVALLADGHVLIEGVPGVAKTLTAKLLARTISTDFSRIQFTPDLMPSDVLGTSIFNFKTSDFEFKRGPIFSNIVLIDEINRSPAKTQAALFEVMEERQITTDGTTVVLPPPFMVLATQNPIEQEGTYRLPEAQLDRFLFKIEVLYPTLDQEVQILERFHQPSAQQLSNTEAVISVNDLLVYRDQVKKILIEPQLLRYIAAIVSRTRNHSDIYLGGSPRASLAIMNSSKAFAAMQGRDFVTPDDIIALCCPVMRHRIMLSPEKEMEGSTPDEVINNIIKSIEVPR